jgi:hypothetical protein
MTDNDSKKRSSKIQLTFVALAFGAPLLLATWMYKSDRWQPDIGSNNGTILQPIVNIADRLPSSPVVSLTEQQWLMLYVNTDSCDEVCLGVLYRLRQSRLMLANEMSRVTRVFLHGESTPDKVFLAEQHAGLITITDIDLVNLLAGKQPAEHRPGGIYLIDPFGNLVMYFSPDLPPGEMVEDIKHLLKLSRIG